MIAQLIPINKLSNNKGQIIGVPKNPRFIKDYKYSKLLQSISDFPEMIEIREIVAYDNNGELVVVGGNMRLRACKELKHKEVWAKILPNDYPIEKVRQFVLKDNASFGDWEHDALANMWETHELDAACIDFPFTEPEPEPEQLDEQENENKNATMIITFESAEQLQKAEIDIKELLDRNYKEAYFTVKI
jgi:hypothetical protein